MVDSGWSSGYVCLDFWWRQHMQHNPSIGGVFAKLRMIQYLPSADFP